MGTENSGSESGPVFFFFPLVNLYQLLEDELNKPTPLIPFLHCMSRTLASCTELAPFNALLCCYCAQPKRVFVRPQAGAVLENDCFSLVAPYALVKEAKYTVSICYL